MEHPSIAKSRISFNFFGRHYDHWSLNSNGWLRNFHALWPNLYIVQPSLIHLPWSLPCRSNSCKPCVSNCERGAKVGCPFTILLSSPNLEVSHHSKVEEVEHSKCGRVHREMEDYFWNKVQTKKESSLQIQINHSPAEFEETSITKGSKIFLGD